MSEKAGFKYANFINSLLNDSSAMMNCYMFWKRLRDEEGSIEFSINKLPFGGNFAFMAGVDEIVNLINNFKFTKSDIDFLKTKFPYLNEDFFEVLLNLEMDDITLYGLDNGSEFYQDEPVLTLSGAVWKIKLLTFPITNLLGFSTLVCTTSVRMRILADSNNKKMSLFEFGLRRAQGPMAGLFASKYSYLGSFEAVSNTLCGCYYNIPAKGTCAHAYIMSFQHMGKNIDDIKNISLAHNIKLDLFTKCLELRKQLNWENTNLSELLSFASFASVYPESANLLVDTYQSIESGVKNTLIVALALDSHNKEHKTNYSVKGIRLDSGDLAELSKMARSLFTELSNKMNIMSLADIKISASNDLNEKSIKECNIKHHQMDAFGIGTNLVTCQLQPYVNISTNLTKLINRKIYRITDHGDKLLYELVIEANEIELKLENSSTEKFKLRSKLLHRHKISYNEEDIHKSRKYLEENLDQIRDKINLEIINDTSIIPVLFQ